MMKTFGRVINKILGGAGYHLGPATRVIPKTRDRNWAQILGIETIIDIGSNEGQFMLEFDKVLPGMKYLAFEPIRACFEKMKANTAGMQVTAYNLGLSEISGEAEINVSENFVSSSILDMEELHRSSFPDSKFVNREQIKLERLDDIVRKHDPLGAYLIKMDVQGYERNVIEGGPQTFAGASAMIIESSFEAFYEGQWLFDDIHQYASSNGFKFLGFSDQIASPITGIPLYADAIFIRKELVQRVLGTNTNAA